MRMQSTSVTEGMSSLEKLSKDDIPSATEVDCICMNVQFFLHKMVSNYRSKNLKPKEWPPLRVADKILYLDFKRENPNFIEFLSNKRYVF